MKNNDSLNLGLPMPDYQKQKNKLWIVAFIEGILQTHRLAIFYMYNEGFNVTADRYQYIFTFIQMKIFLLPFCSYISQTKLLLGQQVRSYYLALSILMAIIYFIFQFRIKLKFGIIQVLLTHFLLELFILWRLTLLDTMGAKIFSQVQAKDEETCETSMIQNWSNLKDILLTVYGIKHVGFVVGWGFYYLVQRVLPDFLFGFILMMILGQFILVFFMCDMKTQETKQETFLETFSGFWSVLKENKILGITFSFYICYSAPAFAYFFDYYLKNVINFSQTDFIIKNLISDIVYLIALVVISFLVARLYLSQIQFSVLFLYLIFVSFLTYIIRIDIMSLIKENWGLWVSIYLAFQSSLFYLAKYPQMQILWKVCPQGKESFFMGMFRFMIDFCLFLGMTFGSIFSAISEMQEKDNQIFSLLIVSHLVFLIIGLVTFLINRRKI